jgi:hypothetical protein
MKVARTRLAIGVALLGAAAVAVASSDAAESRAALRVVDRSPLVVGGARFESGERVTLRILIRGSGSFGKTVVAGRLGGFTTRFGGRSLPRCAGYMITAAGARGTRAELRALIPPPCGVDLQP